MRYRNSLSLLLLPLLLFSCKSGFERNKAGMEKLNAELKKEFGAGAWYTSIEIAGSGSDDVVTIDQTKDPNSYKQEQWQQYHGLWDKKADITLTIQGAQPESFMFQLDKEVSLSRLGELMEQAQQKLRTEKQVDDGVITLAQAKASAQMNNKAEGIYYSLSIESKKARKSFNFIYKLDGSLKQLHD